MQADGTCRGDNPKGKKPPPTPYLNERAEESTKSKIGGAGFGIHCARSAQNAYKSTAGRKDRRGEKKKGYKRNHGPPPVVPGIKRPEKVGRVVKLRSNTC